MSIESRPERPAESGGSAWVGAAAVALLRRPDLWWTAARAGIRHAPNRWWVRAPHLPLPDAEWMAFRYETAFGGPTGRPTPAQVIEYLEWSRDST